MSEFVLRNIIKFHFHSKSIKLLSTNISHSDTVAKTNYIIWWLHEPYITDHTSPSNYYSAGFNDPNITNKVNCIMCLLGLKVQRV